MFVNDLNDLFTHHIHTLTKKSHNPFTNQSNSILDGQKLKYF